ncbi:hypothetical protein E3N88_37547 [Mikania micrantha]|uniref:Uncharacterized protein n=1 Tax=Mikania micrantha TaxID=192012 RepID=A0A5N6LRM6_9ASTR|nr:hypothetical protein E3N88_37547 [Mikania micrantha]
MLFLGWTFIVSDTTTGREDGGLTKTPEERTSTIRETAVTSMHEAKCIKEIVRAISSRLSSLFSNDDEDLIGMETRLEDLESKLKIGSGGVRFVGLWGVGGSGKTTLASFACKKFSPDFDDHFILSNIREESSKHDLKYLQEKLLSRILKTNVNLDSEEEGRHMIKKRFGYKNLLIVLDDVDDLKQLDELAGSHDWFGKGSRIIITTRDEHVVTRDADEIYNMSLLSKDEAIKLFNRHAYRKFKPVEEYESLSLDVVSYAGGLPLALKVLGSSLYDKDKNEWISYLAKLRDIPEPKIMDKLKISYDALQSHEKDLFLDIACVLRRWPQENAKMVLDACNFHTVIGVRELVQKSLINVSNGIFDMHDLIEEMAHYIVIGEHPKHPERLSRVWRVKDVSDICSIDKKMVIVMLSLKDIPHLPPIVANMKKLRWIYWEGYPESSLPKNFQPTNLGCLMLTMGRQKVLWQGYKHLPYLRILDLRYSKYLERTPDFNGLPLLERLNLKACVELIEIHSSIGYLERLVFIDMEGCSKVQMFPPIMRMKKLETLKLFGCHGLKKFPIIQTNMDKSYIKFPKFPFFLRKLDLSWSNLEDGDISSDIFGQLLNLQILDLGVNKFSRLDSSLSGLLHLKSLDISDCCNLVELPDLPSSICILKATGCDSLENVGDLSKYKYLWKVSLWREHKLIGGERVLHSILQRNIDEDRFMSVTLPGGPQVTNKFPYRRIITLQLPQNWKKDFIGFLVCADNLQNDPYIIFINTNTSMAMEYSQPDHWEEFDKNPESYDYALVGYIPFGSLQDTPGWNSAYIDQISFDIAGISNPKIALVPRKNKRDLKSREKMFDDIEFEGQNTFTIKGDSKVFGMITWSHGYIGRGFIPTKMQVIDGDAEPPLIDQEHDEVKEESERIFSAYVKYRNKEIRDDMKRWMRCSRRVEILELATVGTEVSRCSGYRKNGNRGVANLVNCIGDGVF